jgi:hypothetical protein
LIRSSADRSVVVWPSSVALAGFWPALVMAAFIASELALMPSIVGTVNSRAKRFYGVYT